jgi:gluconate kinase
MRAGKIVKSDDRAEWVKKITDEDMITKFKVGQITVDGKKKKAKDEIVKAIIADMRGENE